MVTNINLVSPENANKSMLTGKATLFLSLGLVVLVLAAYAAINFAGQRYLSQKSVLENEIQAEKAKMSGSNYAALADFQGRIDLLGKIVDDHVYWDLYLKELGKYVLPEIRFQNVSGNEKGDGITIRGIASNFEALSRGMILLEKFPGISSVEFKGASEKSGGEGGSPGVEFNLTAVVNGKYLKETLAGSR